MARSGEDEPKYSSFWDCALHLKWTFADLASERRASSPRASLPSQMNILLEVAPAYVQVSVMLK